MDIEQNLHNLGIELPDVAAPVANYVPGLAISVDENLGNTGLCLSLVRLRATFRPAN